MQYKTNIYWNTELNIPMYFHFYKNEEIHLEYFTSSGYDEQKKINILPCHVLLNITNKKFKLDKTYQFMYSVVLDKRYDKKTKRFK